MKVPLQTKFIIQIATSILISGSVYLLMKINFDPEISDPPRTQILEKGQIHNFLSLNKYGNDTSGCPAMPHHFVRVRNHYSLQRFRVRHGLSCGRNFELLRATRVMQTWRSKLCKKLVCVWNMVRGRGVVVKCKFWIAKGKECNKCREVQTATAISPKI